MSTPAIDYDALAQQHGGTAAVDYDALAAQHGGTVSGGNAAPDTRNRAQKFVDNLTTVTPEQEAAARNISSAHPQVGEMLNQAQKFGAGAIQGFTQPFVHPKQSLQALGQLAEAYVNPQIGAAVAENTAKQAAANPAQTAGNLVGAATLGEVGKALAPIASDAANAVTSRISPNALKASGGELLQTVAKDANKVPVSLDNAQQGALKLMDWQKTTNLGPTVNKFLQRITKPNAPALTYEEARKFYQILGGLSADESSKMAPAIKRDLTQMVVGLKQDIGNAADQVGQAANYYQGLGNYALGKRLEGWYNFAKDALAREGVKAVAKGAGVGLGGAIGYGIYREMR